MSEGLDYFGLQFFTNNINVHDHCSLFMAEPVCKGRKQLPNRQCGGLMDRPCPRNYKCVGQLLPVDGPGVCCRKDSGQFACCSFYRVCNMSNMPLYKGCIGFIAF